MPTRLRRLSRVIQARLYLLNNALPAVSVYEDFESERNAELHILGTSSTVAFLINIAYLCPDVKSNTEIRYFYDHFGRFCCRARARGDGRACCAARGRYTLYGRSGSSYCCKARAESQAECRYGDSCRFCDYRQAGHWRREGYNYRRAKLLYARLRLANDLVNICSRSWYPHRSSRSGYDGG